MYNTNPFTLMYSFLAKSLISRNTALDTITNSFTCSNNMFMYLITGIRGMGKTILLRNVYELLSKENNWITIDINPQVDIITSIANNLYNVSKSRKLLEGLNISIDIPYLTITKEQKEQHTDPKILSRILIEHLAKKNKKHL